MTEERFWSLTDLGDYRTIRLDTDDDVSGVIEEKRIGGDPGFGLVKYRENGLGPISMWVFFWEVRDVI